MITCSTYKECINQDVYNLLIPGEVQKNFEIKGLLENKDELLVILLERERCIPLPLKDKLVISSGYMNSITLQHYPMTGKKCYLHLYRRRWKEKGAECNEISYCNEYDYTVTGAKTTKSFGSFLKRNSWTSIPSILAQQAPLPE